MPGEILVRFRPDVTRAEARRVHERLRARVVRRIPGLGVDLVRLPPGLGVRAALRRYGADPTVRVAEPNLRFHPLETLPNDPLLAEQWWLRNTGQEHLIADPPPRRADGTPDADVDAPEAWDVTTGNAVVAVLDTGVDLSHPDLAPNLWVNPGEVPDNGLDDDGNGYADDVHGWDFAEDDPVPQDRNGHGTHVAGIVAAVAGNGVGGAGVCPGCRIMVLRSKLDLAGTVEAIAYAVDNGADVINMSFGDGSFSRLLRRAIARAGARGVLVVAAAGNQLGDNDMRLVIDEDGDGARECCPTYPASYDLPNIIAVAASNHADRYGYRTGCAIRNGEVLPRCAFTNVGHDSVDLAAPGVDVLSTFPSGAYEVLDGTSMAAPVVAGVAGLVRSVHPEYGPVRVKNAILNSVDRPDGLRSWWNASRTELMPGSFTRTDGRVNALRALSASPETRIARSDGTIAGARRIRRVAEGRVAWPADANDVYRKRLLQGRRYRVLLEVPRRKDFDVFIWEPRTLEIWQCWSLGTPCRLVASGVRGRGEDELVVFRARRTGTYYLHVNAWFSRGSYRLAIRRA